MSFFFVYIFVISHHKQVSCSSQRKCSQFTLNKLPNIKTRPTQDRVLGKNKSKTILHVLTWSTLRTGLAFCQVDPRMSRITTKPSSVHSALQKEKIDKYYSNVVLEVKGH